MAVIVGTALQLGEDGAGSPSAIFLVAMTGSMFIAACLHPQEFWCIVPGAIYLLSIPCMYLLLILYSIINLNVVSWGTREVAVKKTKKELEEERKNAEQAKKAARQKNLLSFLQNVPQPGDNEEGSIEFSLAGLFRCMFCTYPKPVDEKQQLVRIAESLEVLERRLEGLEKAVDPHGHVTHGHHRKRTTSASSKDHNLAAVNEDPTEEDQDSDDSDTASTDEPKVERNDDINPYWIEDKEIRKGPVAFLSANELQFWRDLLEKYLYPIDDDKNERVLISKEYLQLEPIGLVFVFFFALIIIIQFIAMMFHRFGTISHILASTELNWCCNKKVEEMSQDHLLDKQAVDIVRHLQRLKGINGDYDNESGSSADRVGRRRTIYNLEKQKQKTRTIGTLDVAFRKRFLQMKMEDGEDPDAATPVLGRKLTMRREVREALEVRRRSLQAERRKSQMQTLGVQNNIVRGQRISNAGSHVKDLFEGHNPAYEPNGDEETNSIRMTNVARNWAELERNGNARL
ncbi:unnamed protein product [Nesidiocoris tenuis]|uniref:Chitin synthase 1 n=1 Tax=Nesidiocoris tenuis TaxID=355587 RepID=A0A6H5G306_9HEMI|nr:unnamed protein product [Nesidiocoris tenuis]